MKNFIKKTMLAVLVSGFMFFLLLHSSLAKDFAALGLKIWFDNMIPTLLPFMILSGLLIRLDLAPFFSKPFGFVLKPIFQVSNYCIYVIVMGFFCGFPMGAKTCVDLYTSNKLTKDEAQYLLSFTNNIGPIYFISYVLGQVYQTRNVFLSYFLMFGLPFIYGVLLRHTIYRKKINHTNLGITHFLNPTKSTIQAQKPLLTLFDAIDTSITNALVQIAILGGYMIFFNLLVLVPYYIFHNKAYYSFIHSLIEISGGLAVMENAPLSYFLKFTYIHVALSFTGLCCLFQTLHLLKETDLSGQKYMLHKIILCSITFFVIIIRNHIG